MNDRFGNELRKILETEIGRLTENLVLGSANLDLAEIKSNIGQILALRRVNERYLEEVESILSKR